MPIVFDEMLRYVTKLRRRVKIAEVAFIAAECTLAIAIGIQHKLSPQQIGFNVKKNGIRVATGLSNVT